ncbi:Caffeic acid 3-O-methyltransferase 1 [Capsicum chinense]|nr:Caffeic acid 3-O-methyltransferase 1 [Capsicum chinense]
MNKDSELSFSLGFSQLESIKESQEVVNFVPGNFDYEFDDFDENRSEHRNNSQTMKKLRQNHANKDKKKMVLRKEDPTVLQVKHPPREEELSKQFLEMSFLRDSELSFSLGFSQLESIKESQEVVNFVPGNFDYEFDGFDENRSKHRNNSQTMKKLWQKHAKKDKKKVVLRKEDPTVLQVKLPPREEELSKQFLEMSFLRFFSESAYEKNCHKALPDKGKVIVVEANLPAKPDTDTTVIGASQGDLIMMVQNPGGKERSEQEFRDLASETGFKGVNLICCVCNFWVMEFHK